jgi:6-phosphogluconolactonase
MTDATPIGKDGSVDAGPPKRLVAYVSGYGPNIAWYDVDRATGTLSILGTIPAPGSPSFLSIHGRNSRLRPMLYAANEGTNTIGVYVIDPSTGALTGGAGPSSGGSGPAHISVDDTTERVLVANYGDGAIAIFATTVDGFPSQWGPSIDAGANAHQIITGPGNTSVFVPCKGADRIVQYAFDAGAAALTPNGTVMTAPGSGPRHLAFHPDGSTAYLINENDSTLVTFSFDQTTGTLAAQGTVSTRAPGASGSNTGAEVAVHPNGRFLYASNRGDDNLAVFAIAPNSGQLSLVGHVPAGGTTPRMFAIDPAGAWLYVANQGSNSVITFAIDPQTGMPARTGSPLTAQQPSFVGFVELD